MIQWIYTRNIVILYELCMYVGLRPAILLPASELSKIKGQCNTGRFIMFSVITNIYNKKTKRPTLIELFTATGIFFF